MYQTAPMDLRKKHSTSIFTLTVSVPSVIFRAVLISFVVFLTLETWEVVTHSDVIQASDVIHVRVDVLKNSTNQSENIKQDNLFSDDPDLIRPSVYWLPSQEVYFSSAFLDLRYGDSVIRVLGLRHRQYHPKPKCIFEIGNKTIAITTETAHVFPNWPSNSLYTASIFYCKTPKKYKQKSSVEICSFDDLPCVKIPLHVVNPPQEFNDTNRRRQLAICGKAYSGYLDPRKLIEWLEINRLVGVDHVIVYDSDIKGKGVRVIDVYKRMKMITTLKFPLLDTILQHAMKQYRMTKEEYYSIFQQAYLVSLNDCILRFVHKYEYFLIIDYDEILLPSRDESIYFTGIRHFHKYPRTSGLSFPIAWHFTDFPKTSQQVEKNKEPEVRLEILEHNRRTFISKDNPKTLMRSDPLLMVNWHGVVETHPKSGYNLNVVVESNNDSAYLHHYRGACIDKFLKATCDVMLATSLVDDKVPRYGERLRERVRNMLRALDIDINAQ